MRQVTHGFMVGFVALGLAGCGGGSSGGGGSAAAGLTNPGNGAGPGAGVGQIEGLAISPPGDLEMDAAGATTTGGSFQLVADGYDSSNMAVDLTRDGTWSVEDDAVVTLSGEGKLEAVAPGTTTVKVTYNGLEASKQVTVNPAPGQAPSPTYTALTIYPKSRTLFDVDAAAGVDQMQQVVVVGTDDQGRQWDLTPTVAVEVLSYNDPSLKPLPPSTAGAISPEGLFRGTSDGNEVLLASKIDQFGLVSGSHFVLGDGRSKPVSPSALSAPSTVSSRWTYSSSASIRSSSFSSSTELGA